MNSKTGLYMSIGLASIGAVAGASTQLTTLFGEHSANMILAGAVLLLTVGNAVNAVIHAGESGPSAK